MFRNLRISFVIECLKLAPATRSRSPMDEQIKSLEQKFHAQSQKVDDQSKKIDDLMTVVLELKNQMIENATLSGDGGQGSPRTPKATGPKSLGYVPKLEFPKFNGSHCRLWIKKCSKYFHLCKIADDQKVDFASLFMIDKAEKWVTSYLSVRKNVDWAEFVVDLSARFKDDTTFNVVEQFNKLHQIDSLETYIDEFEDLSSVILQHHHSIPDEYILESFVGGLKPGVKPFVKALKPTTI